MIPHKCPVCDGQGVVSRPPYVAGDVIQWVDSCTAGYPCPACHGACIVWETEEKPSWHASNNPKVIQLGGDGVCQYCYRYFSNLAYHEARCEDKRIAEKIGMGPDDPVTIEGD